MHVHQYLQQEAAPVQIRVLPSQSKNRLYLGNLPKTITKDELDAQVRAATKGALVVHATHMLLAACTVLGI